MNLNSYEEERERLAELKKSAMAAISRFPEWMATTIRYGVGTIEQCSTKESKLSAVVSKDTWANALWVGLEGTQISIAEDFLLLHKQPLMLREIIFDIRTLIFDGSADDSKAIEAAVAKRKSDVELWLWGGK